MAGRVEDELDRPGQLVDQLGVDEELVDEVDAPGEVDRPRRDAEGLRDAGVKRYALDPDEAARLWDWSAGLTGVQPG